MVDYTLTPYGGVIREADGAAIPEDTNNTHWLEYLAWVAAGGVVDEAILTDLGIAKEQANRRVEMKALNDSLAALGTLAEQIEFRAAELEALHKILDPAIADAAVPLLVARMTGSLDTTAKVANDVMATSKINRGAVSVVSTIRGAELAMIASAVTVAECEAVAPGTMAAPEPV